MSYDDIIVDFASRKCRGDIKMYDFSFNISMFTHVATFKNEVHKAAALCLPFYVNICETSFFLFNF